VQEFVPSPSCAVLKVDELGTAAGSRYYSEAMKGTKPGPAPYFPRYEKEIKRTNMMPQFGHTGDPGNHLQGRKQSQGTRRDQIDHYYLQKNC
jgi:hypothetical protein